MPTSNFFIQTLFSFLFLSTSQQLLASSLEQVQQSAPASNAIPKPENEAEFWIRSSQTILSLVVTSTLKPTYISATFLKSNDNIYLLFEISSEQRKESNFYKLNKYGYIDSELSLNSFMIKGESDLFINSKKATFIRRIIGMPPIN